MDLGLADRAALITGASGVVGGRIALRLAAEGARVGVGYCFNESRAHQLATHINAKGGLAQAIRLDLLEPESFGDAERRMSSLFGGVDVLVHSAVVGSGRGPIVDIDPARAQQSITANTVGALGLARSVLPGMIERRWGRFAFLSSTFVSNPITEVAAYTMAKGALQALSAVLSTEGMTAHVLSNVVALAKVTTATSLTAGVVEAAAVADLVAFLCSTQNRCVSGQVVNADVRS